MSHRRITYILSFNCRLWQDCEATLAPVSEKASGIVERIEFFNFETDGSD